MGKLLGCVPVFRHVAANDARQSFIFHNGDRSDSILTAIAAREAAIDRDRSRNDEVQEMGLGRFQHFLYFWDIFAVRHAYDGQRQLVGRPSSIERFWIDGLDNADLCSGT